MRVSKIDPDYITLIEGLKEKIQAARMRAMITANQELIRVYWEIGKSIVEQQQSKSWGEKFLQQLSADLQHSFPGMGGFSLGNLNRAKLFYASYPDFESASLISKLPWSHVILLMQRIKQPSTRDWYAKYGIENGWSRSALTHHIETQLFERQGINIEKTSNYLEKLPAPQSELALDILKCPYNLKFTGLFEDAHEKDIESQTINHICKFLIELGSGFAFVGRQFPIEVSSKDYFIDLLFYHLKLRAFVVIEIKATEFKPEHAGQLNFYLTAVDRHVKHSQDNPTIGILLCKSHDKTVAEYALGDINKPIGVSNYDLLKAIPENLRAELPTEEELETVLSQLEKEDS